MNPVNIRQATMADSKNLTILKQQVWVATYAVEGIRQEFSDYLLQEFTLEKTEKSIQNSLKITLLAETHCHLIGCVEISLDTQCQVPSIAGQPEISILYVLEAFIGKGTGKLLLNEAFKTIKKLKFNSTWLTVYFKNTRALSFYLKNGFTQTGTTFFELGENKYENKIMLCQIE